MRRFNVGFDFNPRPPPPPAHLPKAAYASWRLLNLLFFKAGDFWIKQSGYMMGEQNAEGT